MSGFDDVIIEHDDAVPAQAAAETPVDETPGTDTQGLPKGVVPIDGGYRLTLEHPVTLRFKSGEKLREEKVAALDFRRLNGSDLRAMMTDERADGAMMLLERIMLMAEGRKALVLDRMDAVDVTRGLELVGFLAGTSRKTGR